jgi:hypothetical protein
MPSRQASPHRRASMAFEQVVAAEVLSIKVHIISATGLTVRPDTFYCHAMAQMQNRNVSGPKEVTCRKCKARPRFAHNLLNPRTGGYFRIYKCECGVRPPQVASAILPLPSQALHLTGYILRPGCTGCITTGKPVPLQATHVCSLIFCVILNLSGRQQRRLPVQCAACLRVRLSVR